MTLTEGDVSRYTMKTGSLLLQTLTVHIGEKAFVLLTGRSQVLGL